MRFRRVKLFQQTCGIVAIGLFCAIFLVLIGCKQKPAVMPPPPPKVRVSQPIRQSVTDYLQITGNTQAVRTVQLVARVEGYLEKVFFKDGDMVKKDQLLFLIQQDTYQAKLQQQEGNVVQQKALLDHAKIEWTRYSDLYDKKAASQQDVENWRYQHDSAQAALTTAKAQRDLAKLDLDYTRVTAPFAGRIDRRLVDPGNLVGSASNAVLANLTQVDPLYVYFNVSETDVSRFVGRISKMSQLGKKLKYPVYMGLSSEEEYPHKGYMDFSAPTVSATTGTLLVRGVFPNADGKILPGQFTRVKVPVGQERSALTVPKVAINYDQLGSYVLVVNEKKVVERRNVKTGPSSGSMFVIDEGLAGNEWVIVEGILKAVPGRQVNPEHETPEKKLSGRSRSGDADQNGGS
jgi:RND family efflux transporter MFP subunit